MKELDEVIGEKPVKTNGVSSKRNPQEYRIYRANKDLKGTATKWNINVKQGKYVDVMLFLEATVQTGVDANGNGAFAWKDRDKTIVMKLEAIDIGSILATFTRITPETKLFHKNASGNTVLNVTPVVKDDKQTGGYYLAISTQRNGKTSKIQQVLAPTEVEILKVLLKDAISLIYYWR